jgi:dienelactone hydrolase
MRAPFLIVLGLCGLLAARLARAEEPAADRTKVRFQPMAGQDRLPARYRLAPCQFACTLTRKDDRAVSGIELYHLTFPSPVKSACPENNTVHADYYRPRGAGPFPCVIVLDILAGNEKVARVCASTLAQNGIGGLFVSLPYYGARRPAGSRLRFLSYDVDHTLEAVRQAVLDLRCATAWMESRPEIDARRLGIMGTSLGSFLAALTAEMEPKLGRVAILLGGGGFVDAFYDDPRAAPYRKMWEAAGGTKEEVAKFLAPVDPLTCAANLNERKVLMIAGKRDEIVLPRMAEALWRASGRQQIVWIDAGHYTAALYLVPGLQRVVQHFGAR